MEHKITSKKNEWINVNIVNWNCAIQRAPNHNLISNFNVEAVEGELKKGFTISYGGGENFSYSFLVAKPVENAPKLSMEHDRRKCFSAICNGFGNQTFPKLIPVVANLLLLNPVKVELPLHTKENHR